MSRRCLVLAAVLPSLLVAASAGCDDAPESLVAPGPPVSLGDAPAADATAPSGDKPRVDGGFATPEGGVVREDRFVVDVVSFTPGPCAGFGAGSMPGIVQGPPEGAGTTQGSLDVVSLGTGGEIVLAFGDNAIVDGPGADFVVFENAFWANGAPTQPAADLAEVSVSADGATWTPFPCEPGPSPPYGACAGWRPVLASTKTGISPFDADRAGGDPYDLAAVGVTEARFVRIRDLNRQSCPDAPPRPTTHGFDLDAIGIVHAARP